MAKVLNLDSLSEETRSITLNGVTHEVVGMSVDSYIKVQKVLENLKEEDDLPTKMKASVEMISAAVPTLKEDVLRAMSMEKLNMIIEFVNGPTPEVEGEGEVEKKA